METLHPGRCESPRLHTGSRKLQVDLSEPVILVIESRAKVLSMEDKDLRIRKSPCFSAARAAPHRREVCSEVAACTMSLGCFCLVSDEPPDKVAVVALALHGGQAKSLVRNPKPEIPQPRAEGLRPRFPLWASVDCGLE